jgi:hypothetical protein
MREVNAGNSGAAAMAQIVRLTQKILLEKAKLEAKAQVNKDRALSGLGPLVDLDEQDTRGDKNTELMGRGPIFEEESDLCEIDPPSSNSETVEVISTLFCPEWLNSFASGSPTCSTRGCKQLHPDVSVPPVPTAVAEEPSDAHSLLPGSVGMQTDAAQAYMQPVPADDVDQINSSTEEEIDNSMGADWSRVPNNETRAPETAGCVATHPALPNPGAVLAVLTIAANATVSESARDATQSGNATVAVHWYAIYATLMVVFLVLFRTGIIRCLSVAWNAFCRYAGRAYKRQADRAEQETHAFCAQLSEQRDANEALVVTNEDLCRKCDRLEMELRNVYAELGSMGGMRHFRELYDQFLAERSAVPPPPQSGRRHIAVQSQTTYTRWCLQPRFRPLPEYAHGAHLAPEP